MNEKPCHIVPPGALPMNSPPDPVDGPVTLTRMESARTVEENMRLAESKRRIPAVKRASFRRKELECGMGHSFRGLSKRSHFGKLAICDRSEKQFARKAGEADPHKRDCESQSNFVSLQVNSIYRY
jgi:hypothetical protein